MLRLALISLFSLSLCAQPKPLEWTQIDQETLKHFSALVQINSADPGGSEKPVVDYLKAVFDREGIESKVFTRTNLADPNIIRPNIIARLKGTGKKKPLLIIGHTDTVNIDAKKWVYGPFSAHREGGYIYGRGTVDDKDNLTAALMSIVLIKRQGIPLERDVIFLAEAGEEGATSVGIAFLVNEHYADIDAEVCIAEGAPPSAKTASSSTFRFKPPRRFPAAYASLPPASLATVRCRFARTPSPTSPARSPKSRTGSPPCA